MEIKIQVELTVPCYCLMRNKWKIVFISVKFELNWSAKKDFTYSMLWTSTVLTNKIGQIICTLPVWDVINKSKWKTEHKQGLASRGHKYVVRFVHCGRWLLGISYFDERGTNKIFLVILLRKALPLSWHRWSAWLNSWVVVLDLNSLHLLLSSATCSYQSNWLLPR